MPAIQSIGLASDGALEQKTIDKLKTADENAQIVPIEKRITETKKQNTELSSLLVSIAGMKGAQNPLSQDLEYSKVSTDTIGKSVNPIVSAGVSPQNIIISVKQLAKGDILQSKTFKTKEDVLSSKDVTIGFSINGRKYDINIKGSDNLQEGETATILNNLPALIVEATSGKATGSIINTGGENPFTLIIKSKDVGKDNAILIGTVLKAGKIIDPIVLPKSTFVKEDVVLNGIQIFDKLSKTKYLGNTIDVVSSFPFQFNPGDLKINDIDIFNNTEKTHTTSSGIISSNTTAKDGDLLINNINIFDTSGFSEVKSSIKIDSIDFPLSVKLNTLTLNGIDIFDATKSTTVTTALIQDQGVTGLYKHNELMINGVSIFGVGNGTQINSVAELVGAINEKSDDTNVSASFTQAGSGIKMTLTNDIDGDNIDINTSEPLQLAKMRLSKGITLGSLIIPINNKQELLDKINSKEALTSVKAIEVDGNLLLRSARINGRINLKAPDVSFINQVGLAKGIYDKPIPVKIESLDDVISYINKKSHLHSVIASNREGKLYLEHTTLGENIDLAGEQSFLGQINLQVSTIKPVKGKLITSIDDVITAINAFKDSSFVEAIKKDNKIELTSTKVAEDINIVGKEESLNVIGLAEILIAASDGEQIENPSDVAKRINDKSSETEVQAFLGNDGKITLLNALGGNIKLLGDESKINILSFSIDDSIEIADATSKKELLEKLGISKASNKLQSAQDSVFVYNGVEITRDNNNIDDIVSGIEFEFKQVDAENEYTNITIKTDKETVIASFFEFITAYNSFIRKVSDLTKFTFDEDNPKDSETGVFQGKTTISNIPFQLSTILGTILPGTKINSLISLGIDFTRDGTLSYKEDEIRNKINSNFKDVENLFRGFNKKTLTGVDDKIDGIFKKLNDKINDLTKGDKSVLESFKSSIEQETGRLSKSLKRTQETIDKRYEQLKQSFIANDAAIGKLNSNFASLKTQMAYETAKQ